MIVNEWTGLKLIDHPAPPFQTWRKRNWVFATNPNFLILIFANWWRIPLILQIYTLRDPTELTIWNIKGLRQQITNIWRKNSLQYLIAETLKNWFQLLKKYLENILLRQNTNIFGSLAKLVYFSCYVYYINRMKLVNPRLDTCIYVINIV